MEIREISGVNINIKDINVDPISTYRYTPPSIPAAPPVTVNIGTPIVDMPGCVEAHEVNEENNFEINEDDPKGVKIFCDGQMPSFNPMDYNKNKLKFEYEQPVPPVRPPEKPKTETPETETPVTPRPECPTREQQLKNPVGKILEGDKKITGYEVVGKECLMVTEKLDIVDQIVGNIPNAGAITTTASIAAIATTSALLAKPLADLL